jgi:hypothetical protein
MISRLSLCMAVVAARVLYGPALDVCERNGPDI